MGATPWAGSHVPDVQQPAHWGSVKALARKIWAPSTRPMSMSTTQSGQIERQSPTFCMGPSTLRHLSMGSSTSSARLCGSNSAGSRSDRQSGARVARRSQEGPRPQSEDGCRGMAPARPSRGGGGALGACNGPAGEWRVVCFPHPARRTRRSVEHQSQSASRKSRHAQACGHESDVHTFSMDEFIDEGPRAPR